MLKKVIITVASTIWLSGQESKTKNKLDVAYQLSEFEPVAISEL